MDIVWGHFIPIACRIFLLWKASIALACVSVMVQVSLLYRKVASAYVLKFLILTFSLIFLLENIECSFSDRMTVVVRFFLLFMSSEVSKSEPSSLHFFHDVLPLRVTVYSSVLSLFMHSCLAFSLGGIVCFICRILSFEVVAHVISSAYLGAISKFWAVGLFLCSSSSVLFLF